MKHWIDRNAPGSKRGNYSRALVLNRMHASKLARLEKDAASKSLSSPKIEESKTRYCLQAYMRMLRADSDTRKRLLQIHGMSLAELRELTKLYAQRYKMAVKLASNENLLGQAIDRMNADYEREAKRNDNMKTLDIRRKQKA